MADLWVVLTLLGFFVLCVLLVRDCDLIIGPDDASDLVIATADETNEAGADAAAEVGAR
jgi:hypothetical protein